MTYFNIKLLITKKNILQKDKYGIKKTKKL